MFRKHSILILLLAFFGNCQASVIDTKDTHALIIDTDCALDDMRAISILLSRPEIKIKGIIVTEGTLLPAEGAAKVLSLLHEFSLDTIPVACGKTTGKAGPSWRGFNQSVSWGRTLPEIKPLSDAVSWLKSSLKENPEAITYICLGPMSTLAETLGERKELLSKIFRIIWYNESVEPAEGFNLSFDKPAFDQVRETKVRFDIISNLKHEEAIFSPAIFHYNDKSTLAEVFRQIGLQPAILDKQNQHHLHIADELVSIYLTNPELFDITVFHPAVHVRFNKDFDLASVKEAIDDMIRGVYKSSSSVVFSSFPERREMYTYDVRKIMDTAIARYGAGEWKACVMTDEFHGHLGVFSIVGAKMGIRAREIFNAGPDVLSVTTYAGTKPPYSCMNDGIQVSTGATIGQGLITVADVEKNRPEAVFTFNGKSILLKLKDEYLGIIDRDIEEGIVKFGLTDDGYWKLVRHSALKYWMEWDRKSIFEIEEIVKTDK